MGALEIDFNQTTHCLSRGTGSVGGPFFFHKRTLESHQYFVISELVDVVPV